MRAFENRVIRYLGLSGKEVMGEWKRLHNEEPNGLYSSPIIIRAIESMNWRGKLHVWKGVYRVLVGKPEGKRPLGRPRRIWEDNIKADLQDVRWREGMDWIDLAQDWNRWWTLLNAVMNLRVP
jgi:hypothetical protein